MPHDPIGIIEYFGYTEREASFLYLVAVHSGYFLRRQFDRFIDRKSGAIAQHFVLKARRSGHIAPLDFGQQRHVYHLCHKNFYHVLEDPDSQNRRRKSDGEIKLRLMALDYALLHLADNFLESREAKAQFFTEHLGTSPEHFPQCGRYTRQPFADRILIVCDKQQKVPRFAFIDEGMRSLARFEKFLSDYKRLLMALSKFDLVYVADTDVNFAEAGRLLHKIFPQARTANAHALYPKGPEHLWKWLLARARYDAGLGGLLTQDFLLLREGNPLYTTEKHKKLYEQWIMRPFTAGEIPQRLGTKSSAVSFRTELLELTYPIFTYRHLPTKAPAIDSTERATLGSTA
jgi:hypothetical protein